MIRAHAIMFDYKQDFLIIFADCDVQGILVTGIMLIECRLFIDRRASATLVC